MLSNLQFGNLLRQCATAGFALVMMVPWSVSVRAQTVSIDNVAPIALSTSSTEAAVSIDAVNGNVIVRTAARNYATCAQAASPAITNFFPTNSTVAPGAQITLNWSSTNATSCSPSQGSGTIWPSLGTNLPPSGSQSFNAPANNGAVTFQLNCTNGSTTVSANTQVTVQTTSPGNCTPIYPNGQPSPFNAVFGAWPAFNVNRRVFVPQNGYVSFEFVATSASNQFGTFASTDFFPDGDGFGQMSISRVSGCFTPSELGSGCLGAVSRFTSVGWKNGAGNAFQCGLTAGQTYYVNFTYGNATSASSPARPYCPAGSGNCGADVGNIIQD